jgi:hypothetical protein
VRLFFPLLFLAVLLPLAGCGYEAEIARVQQATTGGLTNEDMVNNLAGARGSVDWTARKPGEGDLVFAEGADVIVVVAKVEKPRRDGTLRTAEFLWAYNRGTEQVALERFTVDGKPQDIASGLLNMLLLQLE